MLPVTYFYAMYEAFHPMTPPPRPEKPSWAAVIKARRAEVVGSQEDLAVRAEISQSLVSQIERGVHNPTSLSVDRFAQFLDALNWSAAEFSAATGIEISGILTGAPVEQSSPKPRRINLPQALREAIEKYSRRYPDLRDPTWQNYLAGFRWREGEPEEPEAWLDLYRDLIRAGVVPGSN